jgi:hypothetical protein
MEFRQVNCGVVRENMYIGLILVRMVLNYN